MQQPLEFESVEHVDPVFIVVGEGRLALLLLAVALAAAALLWRRRRARR